MMHIGQNTVAAFAAVVSIGTAMISGTSAIMSVNQLPMIEGTGRAPEVVAAGQTVTVAWDIIKRTDCAGVNSRVWHGADGVLIVEPRGETTLPQTSDMRHYEIETRIPDIAVSGPLALTIEGEYTCAGSGPVPFTLGPVVMEVE